jgi:hypothetical protein
MRHIASAVVVVGLTLAVPACGSRAFDYCENSLREHHPAPGGTHQVAIFDRSCGRSPSTTNLSVLHTGASIPDEPGNAYSVEGAVVVGVEWTGPAELTVIAPNGARSVKQDTLVDGVRLRYREADDRR